MNRLCYLGLILIVSFMSIYSTPVNAAIVRTGSTVISVNNPPFDAGDWRTVRLGTSHPSNPTFGELRITEGNDANAENTYIGNSTGIEGRLFVEDAGSTYSSTILAVGANANGSLTVQNDATVTTANLWLGVYTNSEANVTVTSNSTLNASLISQGTESEANIYISDGSELNVSSDNWSIGNGFKHTTTSLNLYNNATVNAGDISFSPWTNTTLSIETESRLDMNDLVLSAHSSTTLTNRSHLRADSILYADRQAGATSGRTRNITLRNGSSIGTYEFTIRGQSNITIDDSQLLTWNSASSIAIRAGNSDLDSELNIINGGSLNSGAYISLWGHETSTGSYTVRVQGNDSLMRARYDISFGIGGGTNFNAFLDGGTIYAGDDLRLRNGATFTQNGGSVQVDDIFIYDDSTYNFNFGHIYLRNVSDLFSSHVLIDKILTNNSIYANQEIEFASDLNIYTPLVVRGGTLAANQINNTAALYFQTGTIRQGSPLTSQTMLGILKGSQLNSGMTFESGQQMDIFINHLIDMNGGTLAAPQGIVNSGIIEGRGNLNGIVANLNVAQIRALDDDTLRVNGQLFNEGRIEVVNGHLDASTSPVISSASADIIIRNGIFRANHLTNDGSLAVTFGTTDIHGDIVNQGTGRIIISGNSNVTIWDDIQQNSSMHIADGSTLVVFGSYAGAGTTGTGTVFLEGDTRPGFSPGETIMGGDVALGNNHELTIEIGGTIAGTEHDVFGSLQELKLNGDLIVEWYDGFAADAGDEFDILDWDTLVGSFDNVDLSAAALAPELSWDTSSLYTSGVIKVVPEPTSLLLFSVPMFALLRRRSA
ncbi:hypothetical protein KS4_21260 [Poriferisphaera corsica]|uniref:Uncharacterized protein n=1 Tax=Poriferisphaera corsica TaxID=2528020 RepID=A0A517YV27_9BACT|nr:hypothetical protein [Poriferisphaera corsica]QDU34064.1 hypothetical protein KS4_21260 [Poriferisphaera corsica]